MKRREYERMAAVEDRMWWFRALHRNLILAVTRTPDLPARPKLLDAGCGTGGLLQRLSAALPGAWLAGLDADHGACRVARTKSGRPVLAGSVNQLPVAAGTLDGILSADVLSHQGVDVEAALRGFHRALRHGGVLILNLPAYPWLFSAHDRAVDNARRFERAELIELLDRAGFTRIETRYWNCFLFPLMLARRLMSRHAAPQVESDVALLPGPVETLFAAVTACESWVIGKGLPLPFGGSILATAMKS